jgi:NADPH:quinone reductase-like Zn-dependent oxidoreductase
LPVETVTAVLRAFAEPLRVEPVTLREPGPGEVLVGMVAAGVCHSDVGQADGEWSHPLPVVLGHEGASVVEVVGPGVDGLDVTPERLEQARRPGASRLSTRATSTRSTTSGKRRPRPGSTGRS